MSRKRSEKFNEFHELSKEKIQSKIELHQRHEITEAMIYRNLAKKTKDLDNKKILKDIAKDEIRHYETWKKITNKEFKPNMFRVKFYTFLATTLGLTFALRLLESNEVHAQNFYENAAKLYPDVHGISYDEEKHEQMLIAILNDEKLSYAGSIVLGLNDALVELTGTLAGLSLAFTNSTIVGVTGIIMGIAASLSMAASEFLSTDEDDTEDNNSKKSALKSAMYTGIAYIITVILLVSPYFIFSNINHSLIGMLTMTLLVILSYTSYISVAKNVSFKKKFLTMAAISLGVAAISFGVGYFVKVFFGI